jgi:thioredoxin reductase
MTSASKIYDVLIAGSGPAGLSVALCLSRVRRTAAIFTKPNGAGFRNQGVVEMHNVLSRDKCSPEEFRSIGADQIKKYGTTDFFESTLIKMSQIKLSDSSSDVDGFEVEDTEGRKWRGRKLALAMGSVEVFPNIEGYSENWPHNM